RGEKGGKGMGGDGGGNGKDKADERQEIAQPRSGRLQGKTQKRAEQASEQGMPAEPEERVASAELCTIGRSAKFGEALRHVEGRLEPIEAKSDEAAIDDTVAHVV